MCSAMSREKPAVSHLSEVAEQRWVSVRWVSQLHQLLLILLSNGGGCCVSSLLSCRQAAAKPTQHTRSSLASACRTAETKIYSQQNTHTCTALTVTSALCWICMLSMHMHACTSTYTKHGSNTVQKTTLFCIKFTVMVSRNNRPRTSCMATHVTQHTSQHSGLAVGQRAAWIIITFQCTSIIVCNIHRVRKKRPL